MAHVGNNVKYISINRKRVMAFGQFCILREGFKAFP